MIRAGRVSRVVQCARPAVLDNAAAVEKSAARVGDVVESSRGNAPSARTLGVRQPQRQDSLRLVPRRQVHLIRALADYSTQERVGFSLDSDNPFRFS